MIKIRFYINALSHVVSNSKICGLRVDKIYVSKA